MYPKPTKTILLALIGLGILWLCAEYVFPLLLPFALGAGLCFAAEPMVRLLTRRLHLPRWAATAICVSAVCALVLAALTLALALLARQMRSLSGNLEQWETAVIAGIDALEQALYTLASRLPGGPAAAMQDLLQTFFSDSSALLQQLATRLPQVTGRMLGNVSEGIFVLITGILSGFMLSVRLPAIKAWLQQWISQEQRRQVKDLLQALRHGLFGWLQAQLKLAGVTFGLLAAGFWVLQVDRWLPLAALIAIVDAFPVLGVGTVLLPWALVCLLLGQTARGVGLLALFVTIWLLRSLLEPRLVGKSIGLDPLLTLAAIYAGFQLWGIGGMVLAPMAALLGMLIWQQLPRHTSPPNPR